MWLLLLLSFWIPVQESSPYVLVLTNGKTMNIREPPTFKGRLCSLKLLNGETTSLPSKMIDRARTDSLNDELSRKRAEAEEAEKNQSSQSGVEERRKKPRKPIELKAGQRLPVYDRGENTVAGNIPVTSPYNKPSGPPKVTTFDSQDAVYVAREVITPYKDHQKVECQVKVNHANGVENVRVQLKVNYENEAPGKFEDYTSPKKLAYGETATVAFILKTTDPVIKTSYFLSGDVSP